MSDDLSDLQAFFVVSQHPKGAYCAGKPLESVICWFYELTIENDF